TWALGNTTQFIATNTNISVTFAAVDIPQQSNAILIDYTTIQTTDLQTISTFQYPVTATAIYNPPITIPNPIFTWTNLPGGITWYAYGNPSYILLPDIYNQYAFLKGTSYMNTTINGLTQGSNYLIGFF